MKFVLLPMTVLASTDRVVYEPTWESLDSRPTPTWWQAQKFSLFMHWGLYAVPAYCPVKASDDTCYAEHFWDKSHDNESEQYAYMKSHHGEHFEYQDFAPLFRCENWEPKDWAALFKASGAQGLTMTSKHHEGWALWPSAQHPNWNAVDTGPHRDLLHEMGKAVRAEGMRFGFYYSLMQWDRAYTDDTGTEDQRADGDRYVNATMLPDLRDLIERYEPDVMYVDGEWSYDSDHWRTKPFLAWLFNDSPVREKVAINDRWGNDCRGKHGGFYVCEYGGEVDGSCISDNPTHPWTSHEGMGKSFGYNAIDEYKPAAYFVSLLVQSVAFGGNLQLNVGPTADGRVPQVQADILLQMGRWLAVNGESIYNTTGHPFGIKHGCINGSVAAAGRQCYTKNEATGDIYVATTGLPLSFEFPPGVLQNPPLEPEAVSLLGADPGAVGTFNVSVHDNSTVVGVPPIRISALPAAGVESSCFVFKIKAATAPIVAAIV